MMATFVVFFVHSTCRCELDISDCQQPVPLGGSCQARGRLLDVGYCKDDNLI